MLRMTSIALDTDMPASALGIFAPFRVKISAYLPRLGESQRRVSHGAFPLMEEWWLLRHGRSGRT